MTRPIFEPTMERTDAALGYDKAQLQRRPAPIGSGAVQWIRLVSETTQTFGANDRLAVVYPDSITNNYPDIFDTDTTGGQTFAVLLLTTGLYQATVRVNVDAPEPPSGFSLELLGTDYNEGLSGFHSVYYPGFVSGGASFPPPNDGYPYTSSVWEKSDHMFMGAPTFFAGGQWEIEAFISTIDTVDILAATLEVRRIGDVDFFPYEAGS